MLERIYKYRATCDGQCGLVIDYETTNKKEPPQGWVFYSPGGTIIRCPKCHRKMLELEMSRVETEDGKKFWENEIAMFDQELNNVA